MTLPLSGPIGLSDVNVELGKASTTLTSVGAVDVRTLFGIPSGEISLSDGYGKSNVFSFAIASNQVNANLRTLALSAGWNGTAPVEAVINSGVWIVGSLAANSTAALTIDGSWPNGVTLINNGAIVGRGGAGGAGQAYNSPGLTAGQAGGRALLVSSAVSINNIGTIAGGGGGGGGGARNAFQQNCGEGEQASGSASGGGGGGGRSNVSYNSSGGAGGGISDGQNCSTEISAGAGATGTSAAQGAGGAGGIVTDCFCGGVVGGVGGAGGAWGSAGAAGQSFLGLPGAAGGAAGQAVSGNSSITWIATGTRLGPIV